MGDSCNRSPSCLDSCVHSFQMSGVTSWHWMTHSSGGGALVTSGLACKWIQANFLCFWFLIKKIKCFVLFLVWIFWYFHTFYVDDHADDLFVKCWLEQDHTAFVVKVLKQASVSSIWTECKNLYTDKSKKPLKNFYQLM